MYDYGARNYDPSLGRWMNVDPLAEKYFSKTPYMYCNNNPVLYIDPNGMYFTKGSLEYINGYKSGLNKDKNKNNEQISKFKDKIAKGGSENDIQNWTDKINGYVSKNEEIDGVLGEIQALDESSQAYHIAKYSPEGQAVTGFMNLMVVVSLPVSGFYGDLLAHELKHAYQFETGELSISQVKGDFKSFLYDKTDEIEGFKRGNENYGANNLPDIYKDLPNGPLNVHNNQDIIKALSNPDENKQKQALQNIANSENAAFRVNCQTYSKK